MKKMLSFCLGLVWLGFALPGWAGGLIIVDGPIAPPLIQGPGPGEPPGSFWPGPRPHPPFHAFAPLIVESEKFDTRITDQVAVTAVDEVFFNPNPQRLEGTFVFPLPKGAQIDKFTLEIDGRQVPAELLAADKARGIYEDIVRRQRDPALMEYAGRDVLKVRIFPIEPNSRKRITLTYTQVLRLDSGLIDYVLPLDAGKYSRQPIKTLSVKVAVETKRPLKSIYSPSHAVEVRRNGAHRATAGYEATDVQPNADFQLYFAPEKDEIGVNLLTYRPEGEDGYFLLLASPGLAAKERRALTKDVVFVLDTSGSMAGAKMQQARKALEFCVENLNDGDRFEVIRFSTEVESLFNQLVPAGPENRAKATAFIKDLRATGATAIDDALRAALALEARGEAGRPCVIVFLTDGMPTVGITDEDQIVAGVKERNKQNRRIFCFGIGTDVNTHLLDRITEETRASSEYVLPEEDIEVKVSRFFTKIKEPVLANPTLQFTAAVRASKLYPAPLPDLFNGEQLLVVGRYTGKGNSAAILEGYSGGEKVKKAYELDFPAEAGGHEFIARLWGTRRVGYLLEQIRLHGEAAELKDEVTELARKYGIVTPYTAYLIVEDESRRGLSSGAQSLPGLGRDAGARQEAARSWRQFTTEKGGDAAVLNARSQQAYSSASTAAGAIQAGGGNADLALGVAPLASTPPVNSPAPGVGQSFGGAPPRDAAYMRRYGRQAVGAPASAALAAPAAPGGPDAQSDAASRMVDYTRQTQFAGGRNFFQNNGQWIDAGVQKLPKAKHVRIQFGSPEYFDLIKRHPETAPWLALGPQVQFVLGGEVWEVSDQVTTPH